MATSGDETEEGIKSKKILALKKSRSGVLGHLTRTYREIESLMLSYTNKDEAVKQKECLDDRFEHFKRLSENILELLDDPEDQEETRNYFENQNRVACVQTSCIPAESGKERLRSGVDNRVLGHVFFLQFLRTAR